MSPSRAEERLKRAQELNEEKRRERRRLFTGREDLLGLIKAKLATGGVLVFWGVAGSGKTWLLEQARDTLCQGIPHARLDFRHGSFSAEDALWQLRDKLTRQGLSFPSFDVVWNEYAERTARPRAPDRTLGVADEVFEWAEVLEPIPIVGEVAKLPKVIPRVKKAAQMLERRLGKGWAGRLNRMEAHELIELMPGVFADDLEAALEAKGLSTAVIFLDTYEALQARGDAFVQELAANAPHALFVIGGLDRVEWAGPEAHHRVRDFGREEAIEALARRGVTDEGIRRLIYEVTRGHPWFLALAAAWALKAQEEGRAVTEDDLRRIALEEKLEKKGRTLLEEFLRQLKDDERDALQLVAVPRWFEEEMLERLLSRPESAPRLFKSLVRYDFVEPEERVPEAYRLHSVVRDLLLANLSPRFKERWHRELVAYFAEKAPEGGFPYLVEQVYHQFILDEEEGYALFETLFAPLLGLHSRLGECEALLGALPKRQEEYRDNRIWQQVQGWRATLWWEQGRLGKAGRAFREVAEAPEAPDWLRMLAIDRLGRVLRRQRRWDEAIECFEKALAIAKKLGRLGSQAKILGRLGSIYRRRRRWDDATKCCEEALVIFRKLGDRPNEGRSLSNLGSIYCERGHLDKAAKCCEEALAIFRELGDKPANEAKTLGNLGRIYRLQGRWDEAIKCCKEALAIFRELGDRRGQRRTLVNLGRVYLRRSQWDKAIKCWKEALAIARKLEDRYPEGKLLMSLGNIYSQQDHWDEAVGYYEEALAIFQELGDRCRQLSRWDKAVGCYKEGLTIARELGDRHGEGEVLINLGNAYRSWGRWDKAIECFKKALPIFRELGDRKGEARTLGNLGSIYLQQGHWEEAIECWEKNLVIARELGDKHAEKRALGGLGSVYLRQGRWEEAIEYYEESLALARELGDRRDEMKSLGGLGSVYLQQGRWAEAIECYQKGLRICQELGDRHGEGKTLGNLANVYAERDELDKALETAGHALHIFDELKDYVNLVTCHRQMASFSLRVGDSSACFDHLAQALSLALQIHPKPVVETLDDIVDTAKGLGDRGKWEEEAALGGELFKLVMEMEKEGWKNKELEAVGVLARRVCAVIALSLIHISEPTRPY